jgi:hypothetical protein
MEATFKIEAHRTLFRLATHKVMKKTSYGYRKVFTGSKKQCKEFVESVK